MTRYSDLELTLRKRDKRSYAVSLRFNGPGDEAEQRSPSDPVFSVNPAGIDEYDPIDYGRKLGAAFFTDELKAEFTRFRSLAQSQLSTLRVRISIEASAPELHSLHWETLPDPAIGDLPLFMGDNTVVSRFLASGIDSRPVRLRPRTDLKALVVVANPAALDEYDGLAPVDVPAQLAAAKEVLEGDPSPGGGNKIAVKELAPGGAVPLNTIVDELRNGDGYDILYLVCHGQLLDDKPNIFLEDAGPQAGADLVSRIWELDHRPRLIVLASCQSAGKGGVGLAGLGPRLAEAGIPAVVAMQGNITMDTAKAFMRSFFTALVADGQIDRAISTARGSVRKQDDWWMPVLFLRLRNGRIWYTPGFEGGKDDFDQWEPICKWVRKQKCVPILGPDVCEHLLGTAADLAATLAGDKFPLESWHRSDLAKVTQYLTIQNSEQFARDGVREALEQRLLKSASRILGKPIKDASAAVGLLSSALATSDTDPLRIAAGLDAKVFVNASGNELLGAFLRNTTLADGTKKQPVEIAINWRDERRDDKNRPEPVFETSVQQPLLYHVFGKVPKDEDDDDSVNTWVLTEDDFFDYLIATSRFALVPKVVSDALVTGSLLFLGFPLDDWKFRVLFRLILARGGSQLLRKYNHVAVQVDPGETTLANAQRARRNMEKYFGVSNISIYWGTAADFLRDLDRRLKLAAAATA
jgi:hypothetical protein